MTNTFSRIRFLPITIFAATLMLTVKIGDIWQGFDGILNGTVSIAAAKAQQKAVKKPAAAPQQPDQAKEVPAVDAPESPGESSLIRDDPTLLTQAEIDLLQQLAERRETLEAREKEMEMRSGLLQAAESRIDKKVAELKKFQITISKLIKTYEGQQENKMKSLVKIYENMKPKDAAKIFENLEIDTLLMVAERMKERKLAPIMAKMDPARATEITIELARNRDLPKPGEDFGG